MMCILCSRDVVTSERTRDRTQGDRRVGQQSKPKNPLQKPLLFKSPLHLLPIQILSLNHQPIQHVGACSSSSVLLRSGVHVSYGLCKSK